MSWYIQPENKRTNDIIAEPKRSAGTLVEDYYAEMKDSRNRAVEGVWSVSLRELRAIMDEEKHLDLKFTIYRTNEDGETISVWEPPKRKRGDLKIILPIMAMDHDYNEVFSDVIMQSRNYCGPRTSYCPTWIALSLMKRNPNDKEQVVRGFETIYAHLLAGAYHKIMILGDKITSGMEKIILFAYFLNIPVRAKTQGGKTALIKLLGKIN